MTLEEEVRAMKIANCPFCGRKKVLSITVIGIIISSKNYNYF